MHNTTQKKVKQRCLYGEQFMDSKGLQGVLGYIFGLQGKREVWNSLDIWTASY